MCPGITATLPFFMLFKPALDICSDAGIQTTVSAPYYIDDVRHSTIIYLARMDAQCPVNVA